MEITPQIRRDIMHAAELAQHTSERLAEMQRELEKLAKRHAETSAKLNMLVELAAKEDPK